MKYIYCYLIILASLKAKGQKKPVSLTVNGIRDYSHEEETFKIRGEVLVLKGDTIQFDPVTYTSEFMCNLGAIGLDFERLENDCYQSMRPDCQFL